MQKLVYYAQAWCLAWNERPLFDEPIEAWVNGPVVRSLFAQHARVHTIHEIIGDPSRLSAEERDQVAAVVAFYGSMDGDELAELTHREPPWREARRGLPADARSRIEISRSTMRAYHSGLAGLAPRGQIAPQISGTIAMLLALPDDELDSFLEEESGDPHAVLDALSS